MYLINKTGMLISNKQLDRLNEVFTEQFVSKTAKMLQNKHPELTKLRDTENMKAFVVNGMNEADDLDITEDHEIIAFLEYQIVLGPKFYEDVNLTWVQKIFRVRNISGSEKIERMLSVHPL